MTTKRTHARTHARKHASMHRYVLMTTYLNCRESADMTVADIPKGYFAPHNYCASPFKLDFPMRLYREADPKLYKGMYLGLWKLPFGINDVLP
jgi:hypothetical protein